MPPIRRPEKPARLIFFEIILPALIAANLLAGVLFLVVVPQLEQALMEERRTLMSELTQTVVSLVGQYQSRAAAGELSAEQARTRAREAVRSLRYGPEGKDYFWITDASPTMIMHPYLPELEGRDLSDFTDQNGNRLFVDMAGKAVAHGRGYADYLWQWKDDASRVTPKLSYVQLFKPWGWVIGTGVYVDDVRQEVGRITRRLVLICAGITLAIAAILAFITLRSLRIARQRERFALGLKQSRERYKTLLESTTEGVMLVFADRHGRPRISYANQTLQRLLGYSQQELAELEPEALFAAPGTGSDEAVHLGNPGNPENLGLAYFKDFVAGAETPGQFEAVLAAKDGAHIDAALLCSRMETSDGGHGVSVIVKDMRQHKELAERFEAGRQRFDFLAGAAAVGVFRASAARMGRFLEANDEAARLVGLESAGEMLSLDLDSLLSPRAGGGSVLARILSQGTQGDSKVEIRVDAARPRCDDPERPACQGRERILNLTAHVVRDNAGFPQYVDGILQDVTQRVRAEQAVTGMVAELQTAGEYLTRPVGTLARPAPLLPPETSLTQAARAMNAAGVGALLVGSGESDGQDTGSRGITGIVTEWDVVSRAAAAGHGPETPVSAIMSSPVLEIAPSAMAAEALVALRRNQVRHLMVTPSAAQPDGPPRIIEAGELLAGQNDSVAMLLWRVRQAGSVDEVVQARAGLPVLVRILVEHGADPRLATRIFATVSDAVAQTLTALAVQRLGPPPTRFCFFSMGSQGRLEQTLKTDQDNALVWEDDAPPGAEAYFAELGTMLCDDLHRAGYALCTGEIMAKNPQWRGPLAFWQESFTRWVREADPENLLWTKIFFDFRATYGEAGLLERFHEHLDGLLDGKAAFFNHLAKNCLLARPPLGLFGQFERESAGEHANTFNIKKAMTPVVDFARIYALRHRVRSVNTLERLDGAYEHGALNKQDHQEITAAYIELMGMRLTHQALAMRQGLAPDNFIDPRELTSLQRVMLKEIFRQVGALQKKLSFDFTGLA